MLKSFLTSVLNNNHYRGCFVSFLSLAGWFFEEANELIGVAFIAVQILTNWVLVLFSFLHFLMKSNLDGLSVFAGRDLLSFDLIMHLQLELFLLESNPVVSSLLNSDLRKA